MIITRKKTEWISLVVCLILVGIYIASSAISERNQIEQREHERLSSQAKVIETHVSWQLNAVRRVLINMRRQLSYWQQQTDGVSLFNRQLEVFREALPGVRSLSLLNKEGVLLASDRPELIDKNFNFSEREYFQLARNNPDPELLHVSPPFKAITGNWIILLSMTVLSEQNEFAGLVIAALDPSRFRAIPNAANYTDDMWSAIAHADGLQFMMEPDRPGQSGKNLAQPGSFFTRHKESGRSDNVFKGTVYATGEYRIMALRTIQPVTLDMDKPLIVAVGRDYKRLFERWEREIDLYLALYALLCIISCVALFKVQRTKLDKEKSEATAAVILHKKNAELQSLNEQLQSLAVIDGLTGISNRRRFDELIDKEWKRCLREKAPLALLMIDVDHFKEYNDHYGHLSGDSCLKEIAHTLKQEFGRSSDIVARYGGEEFTCLLPKLSLDEASTKAESIRAAIEQLDIPHKYSSTAPHITISIGIAVEIPTHEHDFYSLIATADQALYAAKNQGRNRVNAVQK